MRKWGIVVTLVYAAMLVLLVLPALAFLVGNDTWASFRSAIHDAYSQWEFWIAPSLFVAGEATLLFLSVDVSHKRLRPRTHLLVSCIVAALFTALLAACTIWSLGVAVKGEDFTNTMAKFRYSYGLLATLWVLWAGVFYLYLRNSSDLITRVTSWLLKGSVLELLVAVPCHVIVRRRHECSAPSVSGFGIASGLAIMLMSFGPGVLLLYKKRLDAYSDRTPTASPDPASAQGRGAGAGK